MRWIRLLSALLTAPHTAITQVSSVDKFIGVWKLIAFERTDSAGNFIEVIDSKLVKVDKMKSHPTDLLTYTREGFMAVQIREPSQPKFKTGNWNVMLLNDEIQCDTAKAALSAYYSYYGRFSIDISKRIVTHYVEGSSHNIASHHPVQQRRYTFHDNNTLWLENAIPIKAIEVRSINSRLIWKRVTEKNSQNIK